MKDRIAIAPHSNHGYMGTPNIVACIDIDNIIIITIMIIIAL